MALRKKVLIEKAQLGLVFKDGGSLTDLSLLKKNGRSADFKNIESEGVRLFRSYIGRCRRESRSYLLKPSKKLGRALKKSTVQIPKA